MQYDIIIPFGMSCLCSDVLRDIGLQVYSYPFDWTGGGSLSTRVDLLVNDFKDWLNYDDLVQIPAIGNSKKREFKDYANIRTNMTLRHHFLYDKYDDAFKNDYTAILSKYRRREERLLSQIAESKNVLFVVIETPQREKIKDYKDMIDSHSIMSKKFMNTNVDLLYFQLSDNYDIINKHINNNIHIIETFYGNCPGEKQDVEKLIKSVCHNKKITLSQKFSR